MKQKKLMSGFLAGVMALSAITANSTIVSAEGNEQGLPQPVKTYSFENQLDGSSMYGKKMAEYTGEAAYAEGHEGQAVRLGDYGLKLNHPYTGEEYTVSMWVNPSQAVPVNGSLLYIGSALGATEQWVSVAGDNNQVLKVWTNDKVTGEFGYKTPISNVNLEKNHWTLVTVTQSGYDFTLYLNGSPAGSGQAARALTAESNDISIGVNNWDDLYKGLIDEVQVYDQALTPSQVYQLYDSRSEEEIFEEEGFTADERITMYEGSSQQIQVNLPGGVTEENAEISFEVWDGTIASVSEDGTVLGLKEGKTMVTSTVSVGTVTQTRDTAVTVVKNPTEREEGVVADYTMTASINGVIPDASGLGNDASIVNPEKVKFIGDGDRDVMEITGNKSYITLPSKIYESLTDKEAFTVEATYARSSKSGAASWLFCIGSIPQSTGTNYMFYAPYFQYSGNSIRAGIKNASSENLINSSLVLSNDEYYTVDMVFENGKVSLFIDGIEAGPALDTGFRMEEIVSAGTKDGILGYLGKSCWSADSNFVGKIDSFKIYDKALSEEEIQQGDPAYQEALQAKVDASLTEEKILGNKNTGLDNVSYDLSLPSKLDGLDVSWSAESDLIAATGKVYNGDTDREVTLTATVTAGTLKAEKQFIITVKAFDATALKQKLEQANALDLSNFTEMSANALRDAVAAASRAQTQTEADAGIAKIDRAVQKLVFKPEYQDPWGVIDASAPKEEAVYKAGTSEKLYTVPDAVKGAVNVTYASDNEAVAVYKDGTVTAVANGTAMLTTKIEAKSSGFTMEYTTYVIVSEKPEPQLKPGWKLSGDKWYYYEDGKKKTGWIYDTAYRSWFYLQEDTGAMATGWLLDGRTWYYLKSNGAMATGWLLDGKTWYYLKSNGAMATGWIQLGGTWYYLRDTGAMATGWLLNGNTWYYLRSSGAMATGWLLDGKTWYYLRSSGAMATGWLLDGKTWYYLKSNGAMATGWLQLGSKWYYLKNSGAMAVSEWVGSYYVNGSGVWSRTRQTS